MEQDLRHVTRRVFLPPLIITTALLTAGTLLLIAGTIVPPPLSAAVVSQSSLPTGINASPPASHVPADAWLADVAVTALIQNATVMVPPAPCAVALARLTYDAGSEGTSPRRPGPLLLFIETGALTLQLDGAGTLLPAGDRARVVDAEVTLRAGDGLVVPVSTAFVFHNSGPTPVVALATGVFATVTPPGSPGRTGPRSWDQSWSPGANVQPLAAGWWIDPPAETTTFTLRRLNLPPKASAPLTSSGAVILSVEAGALTLLASQGLVWWQPPGNPDGWIDQGSPATLLSGEGALLQERPQLAIRNDGSGPLLLLVLTVTADGDVFSEEGWPMP